MLRVGGPRSLSRCFRRRHNLLPLPGFKPRIVQPDPVPGSTTFPRNSCYRWVGERGDLKLFLTRSYIHYADICFESRRCHRPSWQFLGRRRQCLHAHSMDVPRLCHNRFLCHPPQFIREWPSTSGAKIPGDRSPGWLIPVRRRVIFIDPQNETRFTPTFLASRILRWFLGFWKICASMFYNSASYSPSYRGPRKVTRKCDSLSPSRHY